MKKSNDPPIIDIHTACMLYCLYQRERISLYEEKFLSSTYV